MRWSHALWLAAVVLGVAGCADEAVVGSTNAVKKPSSACTQECTNGTQCNPHSGMCVECLTQADCGGDAGMLCDPKSFECVQCVKRTDCDEHLACVAGACGACMNDDQCGDGAKCDDDGKCEAEDQSDDDVGQHGDDSSGTGGSGSSGDSGSSGKD